MAEIARKTKRYPSDLTEEEWGRIEPLLRKPPKRGRKLAVDSTGARAILDAIRKRWPWIKHLFSSSASISPRQ